MSDDIFAAVANGLSALREEAREIARTASAVSDRIARLRSEMEKQDRTKELLEQIEQYRKGLHEAHRTLASFLKNL